MFLRSVVILCLNILFIAQLVKAQNILIPDTVCVGEPVDFDFNSPQKFTTYTWVIGEDSLNHILASAIEIPNTGTVGNNLFSVTAQATMVYDIDQNVYRAFITSASLNNTNPTIQRLDFGINPHGTPNVVDLGNPSNSLVGVTHGNLEAIEFNIDNNGIYHAFLTNNGIVHYIFGNGLGNPPTVTRRIFSNRNQMMMGMQLALKHFNGNWMLFAGNTYGADRIMKFNLGADLNAIPNNITAVLLPTGLLNYISDPAYFSIIKRNSEWYMFFTSLDGNTSSYMYSFGTDLNNNNPTLRSIGSLNMGLNRGSNFITYCDSFYQIGVNQSGTVYALNYNNNISNMPISSNLGNLYGINQGIQMMKPYWYNDTLWAISSNYVNGNTNRIKRIPILKGNSGTTISKYYNPATTYTFNTTGVYKIQLYCDQADPAGPEAYCKTIVVIDKQTRATTTNKMMCIGDALELYSLGDANNGDFEWSDGSRTRSITVSDSGKYWVRYFNKCSLLTDTFIVKATESLKYTIEISDNVICDGDAIRIDVRGAREYIWDENEYLNSLVDSSFTFKPKTSTTLYVRGSNYESCGFVDSINITVIPKPEVNIEIENELTCYNKELQLVGSGGVQFEWQPASEFIDNTIFNPKVSIDKDQLFILKATNEFGCQGSDTVLVKGFNPPSYFMPNAFSPNNDGLNDLFYPSYDCDFEFISLNIYNRFGQKVFNTYKLDVGWDGTANQKPCDVGVYYWFIEGKKGGEKYILKGNVTLVR